LNYTIFAKICPTDDFLAQGIDIIYQKSTMPLDDKSA